MRCVNKRLVPLTPLSLSHPSLWNSNITMVITVYNLTWGLMISLWNWKWEAWNEMKWNGSFSLVNLVNVGSWKVFLSKKCTFSPNFWPHKSAQIFSNKFAINLLIRLEIQMKHKLKQREQNQLKFSTTGLISKFLHFTVHAKHETWSIFSYHKEALNFKFHMAENFHLQHCCWDVHFS